MALPSMGLPTLAPRAQSKSPALDIVIPEPDRDNAPNWWTYEPADVPFVTDPAVEVDLEAKYDFSVMYQQMRTAQ
jgi:hypothetical protein